MSNFQSINVKSVTCKVRYVIKLNFNIRQFLYSKCFYYIRENYWENNMVITKLAAFTLNCVRTSGKSSILLTRMPKLKNLKTEKLFYNSAILESGDIAYHGSPFKFDAFDCSKIGQGEGFSKRGRGLYIHRLKKFAPYYANIRSKDAPMHLGSTKKLENPAPHVYTVSGLKKLKLKQVSEVEAKAIAREQQYFELENPLVDGLELSSGEICIFPKAVSKLKIKYRDELEDFVMMNRTYPFRPWTTDKKRLEKFI